jgi:LCP family protein required for cell wall assembly
MTTPSGRARVPGSSPPASGRAKVSGSGGAAGDSSAKDEAAKDEAPRDEAAKNAAPKDAAPDAGAAKGGAGVAGDKPAPAVGRARPAGTGGAAVGRARPGTGRSAATARAGGGAAAAGGGSGGGPVRPGGPGGRAAVPGGVPGRQYRRRRRPRWGRIALVVGLAFTLVVLLCGFGLFMYSRSLDSRVGRTDPFSQITGGRPPVLAKGALNMLLLGSDSRDPDEKAAAGSRTDTIILMHVQADHQHAYLISIPRDTYLPIPDHGSDKINAAFAFGGLPLVIRTVEGFTKVHLDHLALIDFAGFQEVTDALGGVDMYVDQTITSIHPPNRTFTKGNHHFNGAEALDYVRQRYQFADGDITRERHQQLFLKAVMDKAASSGTLTNPGKLNAFLQSITKAMVVDKGLSLPDMAWQFHSLRSSDLTFLTSPFSGFDDIDGQSVVVADKEKAAALYSAVAHDQVASYLTKASASPSPGG